MSKWKNRNEGKIISESVIRSKTKEDLARSKAFLEGLLELKKVNKLHSTYVNGVRRAIEYNKANKIYVDFRLDGTVTGRLSCGMYEADEPMGVSFHTLPRESNVNIRKFVHAPPGYKFITADYSTQEMRIMGHISEDMNMIRAFNSGADLHTYTAQLLFNKEVPTKEERQIAKTVSFLIIYGGGAFNLSESVNIPIWKAQEIIDSYMTLYPRVFEYMKEEEARIYENKYSLSIFGRRRHLEDIDSPDKSARARSVRQGVNFTVQSPASDTLLCAFININRRFLKAKLDSLAVATVHDSIEAISKENQLKQTLEIIYDEMVNYPFIRQQFGIEFKVPFKVDIDVGDSFGTGERVRVA